MSSIKLNNLSFAYESGGKLILKDINTEIGDGEFVCILGTVRMWEKYTSSSVGWS